VKPGVKLRTGDQLSVTEPPPEPAEVLAQDIPLTVLYEDDDLIVIDKPAGLVVHPAAGNLDGTLVNALLHHCEELSGIGGVERPGIVHRLDKETSGCLVAAKNDLAHRALVEQFAEREIVKTYLALASGRFRWKSGEIKEPIGRHRSNRQKMAVDERGKPAHTSWRVVMELPSGTLVECTLHTGRTHQIRVHLKHLGHPILGDETYGKRGTFTRQMLHAWRLGFTHPRTGEMLNFQSPIPPDFRDAGVPEQLP
jgi:23S rRNA pseudouridine1911/1915/1917 synthase